MWQFIPAFPFSIEHDESQRLELVHDLDLINLEAIHGANLSPSRCALKPTRRAPAVLIGDRHQSMSDGVLMHVIQTRQIRVLISQPPHSKGAASTCFKRASTCGNFASGSTRKRLMRFSLKWLMIRPVGSQKGKAAMNHRSPNLECGNSLPLWSLDEELDRIDDALKSEHSGISRVAI